MLDDLPHFRLAQGSRSKRAQIELAKRGQCKRASNQLSGNQDILEDEDSGLKGL